MANGLLEDSVLKQMNKKILLELDYNQWLLNVHDMLSNTKCKVAIMTTINILSLPTFNKFIIKLNY